MHDIIIFKFEYSCFCCYFKQPACRFNKLEFDCICKLNSQNEKITYNAKFATIEEYGETKKSLMYSDFFVCKGLLLILLFANLDASDVMIFHIVVELVASEVVFFHRFGYSVVLWLFGRGDTFCYVEMLFRIIDHLALLAFGDYILIYKGVDC